MKICLVSAFPPSGRPLNEYALHVARELQGNPDIDLTILADKLNDEDATSGAGGDPSGKVQQQSELPGFKVLRCWKFGSLSAPGALLKAICREKPDVVWFNLVFSSFGSPKTPVAAFAGLSTPALVRAAGFYTHITLHHIVEHVDLASTGVHREKIYRVGTDVATWALLQANSVSVLLSGYRRTLATKYRAKNVLLTTHGVFTSIAKPPDLAERGNPDFRILAFGHWGTYKRLETLMAAFPAVLKQVPNARLIVAGDNHPAKPGYLESVRKKLPAGLPIEFRGFIARRDVPELFRTSSVLVMPYNSSTGSSGPAHQACEYGLPIVCADIPDFKEMAGDEEMAINFYKKGDVPDLAQQLVSLLKSREMQRSMSERNYTAGVQMAIDSVVRNYLRWFELRKCKRELRKAGIFPSRTQVWLRSLFASPDEMAYTVVTKEKEFE